MRANLFRGGYSCTNSSFQSWQEFEFSRRAFVQMFLGAGLLITVSSSAEAAEDDPPPRRGRGGGRPVNVAAPIHIGTAGGIITVLTGKVEAGQGSRAELTQAAAEELRVPVNQIQLVM